MRQFDVCRLRDASDRLVLVLQHDLVDELAARVVAPLSDRPFRKLIDRLRLEIEMNGVRYVVQIDRLAAIEARMIGSVVGNLAAQEQRIKNAIDLLFFGV